MNEAFFRWLLTPDIASLALSQREIQIAKLGWAAGTIEANNESVKRLQGVIDKSERMVAQ